MSILEDTLNGLDNKQRREIMLAFEEEREFIIYLPENMVIAVHLTKGNPTIEIIEEAGYWSYGRRRV